MLGLLQATFALCYIIFVVGATYISGRKLITGRW